MLDYELIQIESEVAAAILSYLWLTARAAAEVNGIDIDETMLGQTVPIEMVYIQLSSSEESEAERGIPTEGHESLVQAVAANESELMPGIYNEAFN